MKIKIIILMLLALFFYGISFAAECDQDFTQTAYGQIRVAIFDCTADGAGAISDTTTNTELTNLMTGRWIDKVLLVPGTINPAGGTLEIIDIYEDDLLGTKGAGTVDGATTTPIIPYSANVPKQQGVDGALTLKFTGQTVANAEFQVIIYLDE